MSTHRLKSREFDLRHRIGMKFAADLAEINSNVEVYLEEKLNQLRRDALTKFQELTNRLIDGYKKKVRSLNLTSELEDLFRIIDSDDTVDECDDSDGTTRRDVYVDDDINHPTLRSVCLPQQKISGMSQTEDGALSAQEGIPGKHQAEDESGKRTLTDFAAAQQTSPFQYRFRNGDNILTQKNDYIQWRSLLFHQLFASDCIFLVDPTKKPAELYSEATKTRMSHALMAYLISNLDTHYKNAVKRCETPAAVLAKLDASYALHTSARHFQHVIDFNNLRFNPTTQTAEVFLVEFEDLLAHIQEDSRYRMSDDLIRLNLLQALKPAMPDFVTQELRSKPQNERTAEEIKNILLQECSGLFESNRRQELGQKSTATQALTANSWKKDSEDLAPVKKRKVTCYKCGLNGHISADCVRAEACCYNCKRPGHLAADCKRLLPGRPRFQRAKEQKFQSSNRTGAKKGQTKKHQIRKGQNIHQGNNSRSSLADRLGNMSKVNKNKRRDFAKMPLKSVLRVRPAAHITMLSDSEPDDASERMVWVHVDELMAAKESDTSAAMMMNAETDYGRYTRRPASVDSVDGKCGSSIFCIVDTGATDHMFNDRSVFINLRSLDKPRRVTCANDDSSADLVVFEIGDVVVFNEETQKLACLRNVLYAPDTAANLFSLRKILSDKVHAKFTGDRMLISDVTNGEVIKNGSFDGRFWWVKFTLPLSGASPSVRRSLLEEINRHARSSKALAISGGGDESGSSGVGGVASPHASSSSKRSSSSDVAKGGRKKAKGSGSTSENSHSTLPSDMPLIAAPSQTLLRDNPGMTWHLRLNHMSKRYLESAAKFSKELRGVHFGNDILDCADCKLAKAKRQPCIQKRLRSDIPFHRVYSDLMGPLKPLAYRSSNKYIVTFTDDFSRYAVAYAISDKTQVHTALSRYLMEIRKMIGPQTKISELRTDAGTEYRNDEMKRLLAKEEIVHTACETATPQHIAPAERLNLEIAEKVRAHLISSGMPTYFWAYAMNHVLYIHNRSPNASNNYLSPYQKILNVPPSLESIKRFGCETYILDVHAKNKPKFTPRSSLGFLLQCTDTGYIVFDAAKKTVVESKHVQCIESRTFGDLANKRPDLLALPQFEFGFENETYQRKVPQDDESQSSAPHDDLPLNRAPQDDLPLSRVPQDELPQTRVPQDDVPQSTLILDHVPQEETLQKHRSRSIEYQEEPTNLELPSIVLEEHIGGNEQYEFFDQLQDDAEPNLSCLIYLTNAALRKLEKEPESYQEALRSPEAEFWKEAIKEEFDALTRCGTWRIVPKTAIPKDTKVIKARWVLRKKSEPDGGIRYRSRLVAKGFADVNNYDISEIYAPVARLADVRIILIIANKLNLDLIQLDVSTAFLNGTLEKLVYMQPPEGLAEYLGEDDNFTKNHVCEIHKALYGLKVSPKR
ncbi:unnamed protein product, partial [Nesidiocoris tenuis]